MATASVPFPEDLALAQGCAAGAGEALAAFERELMPRALAAAAGILAQSDSIAEVAQALRVHHFVRHTEAPARIADYNGSVPLVAWIRVIARRCALNLKQAMPRWAEHGGYGFDELVLPGTPEHEVARERFRVHFRAAFAEAVKTLEQRERAVLRLHVADGLTLEDVAAAYGVHRTTVARWVATARATVMGRTRESLSRTLGPSASDLDPLLRGAFSNLDLNISAVFRDPTPQPARAEGSSD